MGIIKTIKYVKTINDIADKIDSFKDDKIDDILTAIYKVNVALCYLEEIILRAKSTLVKLSDKLNKIHPKPTPVEEVSQGQTEVSGETNN